MLTDRFSQLIARQLSGEASEEELRELQVYLQQHPEAHEFHDIFSEYWKLKLQKEDDQIQQEIHFQQVLAIAENEEEEKQKEKEEFDEHAARVFSIKRMLVAASIIGLLVLGYFVYTSNAEPDNTKSIALNQVEAKKGIRSYLSLPDGTKVWLNSDSKLEYKDNFNSSIREVTLIGEAYFDVVRDEKRPFIVHTSDIDIKVLGTAFNVKSYPRESSIEATLIHGLIEITNKKEPTSPKVLLHPHEKLVYKKNCSNVSADKVATTVVKPFSVAPLPKNIADTSMVETSWVYNKLIFDGETFGEIAAKMERWYNVKINFRNEKVASIPIHYKIENETVEEALKAMQVIEDFTYKIEANEIEIY
jgi:ferric-dicitrate binding protein FerR (iron transport regulator)